MTWLSLICFSVLFTAQAIAGAVSGKVELRDSRDPGVRKQKDYSGVVVWLEPVAGTVPAAAKNRHARMVQKDKTFTPHVLAVLVGTTVDFPNFDPIFHNAFSNYNGQLFDVGLYAPGTSRGIRFGRPGIVRVFCNIHATMSAIIAVLDTPWFTVSDKSGAYTIPDVPPGDYTIHVFHERATAVTLDGLTKRLTVRTDPVSLPVIPVSESGYLSIPHKNKFDREYPPAADSGGVYPAVRP